MSYVLKQSVFLLIYLLVPLYHLSIFLLKGLSPHIIVDFYLSTDLSIYSPIEFAL